MKRRAWMLVAVSVSSILAVSAGAAGPAVPSPPDSDGIRPRVRSHEALLFDRYLERIRASDSLVFYAVEPYPTAPADAADTAGVRIDGAAIISSKTVASRGPADSLVAWLSEGAEVPAQPRLIGAIPRLEFVIALRDTAESVRIWVWNSGVLRFRGLETLDIRAPEAVTRIRGLARGMFPDYEEIKRAIRAAHRRR